MNFLPRLKLKELAPSWSSQNVLITHGTKARIRGWRLETLVKLVKSVGGYEQRGEVKRDKGARGVSRRDRENKELN